MNLQIIYAKLLELITLCNSIISNGKKIDELPVQSSLNSNSKIHVSNAGTSESITISQIINAFANSNTDRLLYIGDIPPIVANVLTIPPAGCIIDGVNYSTAVDTDISIPFTTTDFTRIDIIVFGVSGIYSIQGDESVGIAVAPPIPDNTVYITQVTVTDSDISEVPVPITGFDFIRKDEKAEIEINDTGVIDFLFLDQRAIGVFTNAVTTIQTVDVDSTTTYQNKKYAFKNHQATPITFEHLSGTGSNPFKFSFPNEEDFVLQPNEVIEFLQVKTSTPIFEFIGKVNFEIENINGLQDALDDKLDASAYNDRFKGKYTSLANLQSAHPTSNDGDYAIVDVGPGTDALEYIWDTNEGWVKGNSTGAATTDALPEGSTNLYWTVARGLGLVLSGLSASAGTFTSSDTLLTAFGKVKYLIDNIATLYQSILVSGTNIKTVDSVSLLGSGDLVTKAFTTVKTAVSTSLNTQDLDGLVAYINAASSYAIAKNERILYSITDTGQLFELIVNNRSVGSGQTALTTADAIELEHTDSVLQHLGVSVKFNQASASAYPFAGGQLNSGTLQGSLTTLITPYSNAFVRFIAASGVANSGYRFSDGNSHPITFLKGTTFFGIINPIVTTNLSAILGMPHASSISGITENTTIGAWFNITGATIQAKCANASSVSTGTSQAITATEWLLCMIEVIDNDATNKRIRFKVRKTDGTIVYNEDITTNIPAYNSGSTNNSTGVRAILAATPGANTDIFGLEVMEFWAAKPNKLKYF